jgi:sugar phosphate isomerase/epimerase
MKRLEAISRREGMKRMLQCGAGCLLAPQNAIWTDKDSSFITDIGVCASLSNHAILRQHGYAFVEESVSEFLLPMKPETEFQAVLSTLKSASLPVYACRIFLPGSLVCVGDKVNQEALSAYTQTALRRAGEAGVKIIVFGSGTARRIPSGFDADKAKAQLIGFLRQTASVAARYGVTIVFEPLNRRETNMVNTVRQGAEIVEGVDHSNLKMMVDIYHMYQEGEAASEIDRVGSLIRHCHIAELDGRTAPVTMKDDFRPFFRALKKIGYQGKLCIESSWENLPTQLPLALQVLRKQISE